MDNIKEIEYSQFFSFKDTDNNIYGFDIMSIYNLFIKAEENKTNVLNPYNRNILPSNIFNNINSILTLNRTLNINLFLNIEDEDISQENYLNNKLVSLFQKMDELGNYTDINWFNDLNRNKLILFIYQLRDIWIYRAQLTNNIRNNICPLGDPFINLYYEDLQNININILKNIILTIIEKLITTGNTNDYKNLGTMYVLSALTLVNENTANALPWLYQSVALI